MLVDAMKDLIPQNMKLHALRLGYYARHHVTTLYRGEYDADYPEPIIETFAGRAFTVEELANWANVTQPCIRTWIRKGVLESRMREHGLYR